MAGGGTLQELEAKMSRLISARNAAVQAAEKMIERANREFDAVALPLGREINGVRKAIEEKQKTADPAQPARRTTVKVLAGMDDDERAYYQQLKKRVKK
jgi:hypothetical protein